MATNYVDYVASPEEPDLDAMRYMLAQRNALPTATPAVDLPSQIPGVQPAPAPQRPLDRVTEQFRRMGQSMNPLLMAKSLQDVATTAVVNPLLMPASIVGEVATGRPVTGSLLARPPQTPLGQDFAEALYGGLEAAKVPHMWPLTPRPAGARPILTPNDVRVIGAQAAHAVREASQIPTDIANVRGAGVQRLSPLTGEPSIGSRIGTAIEGTSQAAGKVGDIARDAGQSTADYMQMRRDMGLSPVPGVPAEFMPDLNMYAVRPRGSSLVYPTVPPTKNITNLAQGTAPHELVEATGAQNTLKSQDALALLSEFNLDAPAGTSRQVAEQRQQAFDSFVAAKAQGLYPDAPSATEAQHAMYAPFSRADEKAAFALKLYDEFRASPEGQAVGAQSLPSSQELQDRHAAAGQWLNTTFLNYIKKHVGAEGDPLVQLASQGLTAVLPDVLGSVRVSDVDLAKKRAKAGMPQESMLASAIEAKAEEVAAAEIAVRKLEMQRNQYRDVAMQQGLADPALLPEYAATTNPLTTAVAKRDKLRTDLANLELGKRYESVADMAITVTPQSDLQARLDYPERQFYPSITRAQPTDMLATASQAGALERTGLGEVAARVYDDVIRGVIPTQDLKNLTVDKYVRRMATGRIESERQQAAALQQMKTDAEARMLDYTRQYVKPENRIGNTNILELHRDSGIDPTTIAQIISDDTAVLDHCVGEGGTPGAKQINPWSGEKRNYGVMYNPATGEKNPDASRSSTSYITMAQQGPGMISSVRDANTGLPVATLEFRSTSSLGKFSLGYASGYQNGAIKPEYHAAVLQYLNNMAGKIKSTDSNRLASNLNALDTQSPDFIDDARSALGVSRQRVEALPSMPRFVSQQDLRDALAAVEAQSAAQQPVTTATAVLRDVNNAIDNAIAEAELPDAVAARARERFDALLANHQMDENGFSPERFDAFIDAVDNTAGDLAAQSSSNAILMADAFANVMDALDGIRNQAMRGMYERQPAASAAAQPAAAQQNVTINDLRQFIQDIAQGIGTDEGRAFAAALTRARESFDFVGGRFSFTELLRDQPTAFAERIAEIAQQQDNAIVEQELLALADRIAPPVPPAQQPEPNVNLGDFEPDPGHPANQPGYADEATTRLQLRMLGRNELVQRVDAAAWPRLNALVDAAVLGVDPQNAATLADDIREGRATDITNGLTAVEREIVARDAQDILQTPQLRQYTQFANNFNPTDFARNLVEDARLDNRHFDIQLLRNQADLLTEDPGSFMSIQALPLEQRNAAARRAQAELRNLMRPLEAQINQRYSALQDALGREDVQELRALRTALGEDDHLYWGALPAQERENVIRTLTANIANLEQQPPQQPANNPNIAPFRRIPAEVRAMDSAALHQGMTHGQYQEALSVATQLMNNNDVADLQDIMQLVRNHTIGGWELFSPEQREYLARELQNHIDNAAPPPERQRPFPPGGAAATRGVPLGNLNIQPATTAAMLRGPDTQPLGNFIQQLRALPGVTREGAQTALLGLERMDPTRRMTKAEFIRELVPSNYDIVDLKGTATRDEHLWQQIDDELEYADVGEHFARAHGLSPSKYGAMLGENAYDDLSANVKRLLASKGITDETTFDDAMLKAREELIQEQYADAREYAADMGGGGDLEGYAYAGTQRLISNDSQGTYGEFGVTHPDQQGTYTHYDSAPESTVGHFRGTAVGATPLVIDVHTGTNKRAQFKTKPNSYVIEEIQSDAQKGVSQVAQLHQVHGLIFKAAIQKGLESGATTVYMPTAAVIAKARGNRIIDDTAKFAPIYDQAIVKEGLKPLLKIPGVTSKMVNGYHEISFTPEAIEHILRGPGQTIPGYQKGGRVEYPNPLFAQSQAIERAQEMYPTAHERDDAADAARHMLAAGYMSKSLSPGVAKALGWAHEAKEAPFRTLGHALGLSQPRYDYEMDMHNNALGVELAKKAKDRADFERLVQESIRQGTTTTQPGRARLMTPKQAEAGIAALKYANGGTVSQPQSLDAMKYELMMRSK